MADGVMRCDRCGLASDLAAGFTRRVTLAGRRTLCVACRRRRRRPFGEGFLLLLLTPALFVLWQLAAWGRLDVLWTEPTWLAAAVTDGHRTAAAIAVAEAPYLLAALLLLIVVHEGGHGLAARLVGDPVPEVSVGFGPVVARARIGGTRLVLRALPLMGHATIVPTAGPGARFREAVAVAAGPAAHAAVVAPALLGGGSGNLARHLVWIGGISLLANLLPIRLRGGQASDGLRLVELARGTPPGWDGAEPLAARAYARAVAGHLTRDLAGAQRWCERGLAAHPADTATAALLAAILLERNEPGEARRRALDLLTADLPPVRRAIIECNLAYADLLLDDPALLPEAADAVARASATLPWEPPVQAASAYVAILQGRTEEGMALVSRALEVETSPYQRAGMLAVRAVGYARSGRFRQAAADVRSATRLSPDDALLPRAVAEVARCRGVAAGTP